MTYTNWAPGSMSICQNINLYLAITNGNTQMYSYFDAASGKWYIEGATRFKLTWNQFICQYRTNVNLCSWHGNQQ